MLEHQGAIVSTTNPRSASIDNNNNPSWDYCANLSPTSAAPANPWVRVRVFDYDPLPGFFDDLGSAYVSHVSRVS